MKSAQRKELSKMEIRKIRRESKLKKVCADRGVVFIKNIPHGFYEKEMYDYFKQFGQVTALKMPRNKDGNAKGYAYIEFKLKEVAMIAAETMNNYLMFDKLLKTEYIPPDKQRSSLFHRASMPWDDTAVKDVYHKNLVLDQKHKNACTLDGFMKSALKNLKIMQEKLKKAGINYNFQVTMPNDKVRLISATTKLNINEVNSKKSPKSGKPKKNIEFLNETDPNLKIKGSPSKISKLMKNSKSKLKSVKNKTESFKRNLRTEMKNTNNKKVKDLKNKIKKVKNLAASSILKSGVLKKNK